MAISTTDLPADCEVLVIGAGIVGASVAAALVQAGHQVVLVDAGSLVAGSTAAGEGNLMLSDKLPGPELELALWSLKLWAEQAAQLGEAIEFEAKGGLVVARTDEQLVAVEEMLARQCKQGVEAGLVSSAEIAKLEPHLTQDLVGGALYPGDCQVQPVLAVGALLKRDRIQVHTGRRVKRIKARDGGLTIEFESGETRCDWAVNAAGAWAGQVANAAGGEIGVGPRRGRILVTEPVEAMIHHKVYEADYLAATQSGESHVQFSAVVEGTASGTILLGSSREFAGFDGDVAASDLVSLARRAVSLYPALSTLRIMRSYTGFRPASPDHLPVIGPDPTLPRLIHASGHEGAGIGLAPATAQTVRHHIDGHQIPVDPGPFLPSRLVDLEVR
jgi:D-hydroxyproline dehydrogenase subunit beta